MASIFVRTVIIYLILSFSMKITGKRQIGELDVSDLVSTLLISELAAIPIDDPDIPLFNAIIPILFIVSLEIIVSFLKTRSNRFKKYVEGKPTYIIFKGRIFERALRENRISLNELLSEMRIQGIGDVRDVDFCILEANGKMSMLKKRNTSDATAHPIVIDGELNERLLSLLEMTENDVIRLMGNCEIGDIFLMTVDDSGSVNIIIKEEI